MRIVQLYVDKVFVQRTDSIMADFEERLIQWCIYKNTTFQYVVSRSHSYLPSEIYMLWFKFILGLVLSSLLHHSAKIVCLKYV